MAHEKLTPTRASNDLNVERFTYKPERAATAKQTDVSKSTKDDNGFSKGRIKSEGRTPFQKLLGI